MDLEETFGKSYLSFSIASVAFLIFFAFVAPIMAYLILLIYFSGSVILFALFHFTAKEGSA